MAPMGRTVQVHEILFGAVKDHCWSLGIREGSVLTCGRQGEEGVDLTLSSGELIHLARHYAWFVEVDPV